MGENTAIDYQKIASAFRKAFLESSIPNKPPMVYENREADPGKAPINSGIHIEEKMLPADQLRSASRFIEGNGIYAFNIKTPKGRGTNEANRLAYAIKELFTPGQILIHEDYEVRPQRAEEKAGYYDGDQPVFYVIPVYVKFLLHVEMN